jgi:hypothetical protein
LDLAVQDLELLGVAGQVGPEDTSVGRVRRGEGAVDGGHHHLGVAGVLPDVGVGGAAHLAQLDALAGVDQRAVEAGIGDGVVQPALQAGPVLDDQVGVGDGLDVGRGGLVVVSVQVGLEQAGHLDPVPAKVSGEVGHLGGGGHHPQDPTVSLVG